ncbi:hypothetical protein Bca52824_032884 [Brassica carinata]|uniref:Uncharacterized protein n=1 Tax=Brassica carinata TaxID=52824 RepID=A0A8X7SDK4_BRACI|nr:hypothetical protein Bca52824_032884 [Brassica carinata]
MGSRGDSEEQFTMHTDYSQPPTLDFASQATLAALAAAEEFADQRIEGIVSDVAVDGKKKASKIKLINLDDETVESDVEITSPIQTSKPRRESSFVTATGKRMLQSTIDGGIGSSSQACRKKKSVPIDDIAMAGGRRRLRNLAPRNYYGSTFLGQLDPSASTSGTSSSQVPKSQIPSAPYVPPQAYDPLPPYYPQHDDPPPYYPQYMMSLYISPEDEVDGEQEKP